jgi:uncharacterized protein YggE
MPIPGNGALPKRWSIIVTTASLIVAMVSACDREPSPRGENRRQVTVVGTGRVEGVPDTLTADVGIEFIAPNVAAAMDQTNQRQRAVIEALVGAGVARTDIGTTDVSLQPEYGMAGYRADNSIQVTIRPPDAAPRVLAVVVNTGGDATRINSVGYSVADDARLVKDARARAFQDAENRAQQYAQLSGLTLGGIVSISEVLGATPPATRTPMVTDVPLQPSPQTVNFSVTAVWELR